MFENIYVRRIICMVLFALIAPWIGGLLDGLDRKLTARMQGRKGPVLLQPSVIDGTVLSVLCAILRSFVLWRMRYAVVFLLTDYSGNVSDSRVNLYTFSL